jgi:glutamine amidotransferase
MSNLRRTGIDQSLEAARRAGALVLGICLGMQLLLRSSEEGGKHAGLDWIKGRVLKFPEQAGLRVPHMGWNELRFTREHALTRGVDNGSDVYFLHSYYCACDDAGDVLATSSHGVEFAAILARDNLLGIQFHPEKSQQPGLVMLRNFVRL